MPPDGYKWLQMVTEGLQMPPDHYSPAHVANAVGISPSTVRAWCAQFQSYLSADARPSTGKERRLSANDVAILQTVRQLRDEGKSIAEITDHLAETPTEGLQPFVDAQPTLELPQPASQPGQDLTPALIMALDTINAMQHRLEVVEASVKETKQVDHKLLRDAVFLVLAGAVGALVIVLIIVLVVDLWAK